MDRYEKSLITLELPAVLELLAAQAGCEAARERCRSLKPADTAREVKERQSRTSAAKAMMVLRGSPSFSGAKTRLAGLFA